MILLGDVILAAHGSAARMERESIAEMSYLLAEADTKGNLLNKRGRAAGIDDRSLFTGPEARAPAYASEELIEHWETHPRPTAAMFAAGTRALSSGTPRRRGAVVAAGAPSGARSLLCLNQCVSGASGA